MTDLGSLLQRLAASAERCTELDEARAAEHERRDQLLCEARDQGITWKDLARAARLSTTRATVIYADRLQGRPGSRFSDASTARRAA